jgi:arylsulfatase A
MFRRFYRSGFAVCLLAGLAAVSAAERPNVIVINVDDLGYADIGPFGAEKARTPHLDRMAAEGRKLTSYYAAPVCSPSRAALMTGAYPKRVLPIPHVLFPAAEVGLHPDEVTVAELLKEAGYATACIGKWHLGDQPGMLPTDQGFDYYYGIPYSNDMGTAEDGAKSNPGQEPPQRKSKAKGPEIARDEAGLRGAQQPPLPLLENGKVIERVRQNEQTTITRRYTEKALEWLRQHKNGPFFLYFPHTAVHFPLYPGLEWRGKSAGGLIHDWVEEVDWSTGALLDAVRELGLAETTLVIFTSDNGGALSHGSSNEPLRGAKGSTFEGGVRVCTMAWWPGTVPAGTESGAICGMIDVLPTLAALAGVTPPSDRVIDGIDIREVLTGDGKGRDSYFHFRGAELQAVRQGKWKLHVKSGELHDLEADLGEAADVAAANPEVVAELRSLVAAMNQELGEDEFGPGCRPLGRVSDPLPLINADGSIRSGFEP